MTTQDLASRINYSKIDSYDFHPGEYIYYPLKFKDLVFSTNASEIVCDIMKRHDHFNRHGDFFRNDKVVYRVGEATSCGIFWTATILDNTVGIENKKFKYLENYVEHALKHGLKYLMKRSDSGHKQYRRDILGDMGYIAL